MFNVNINNFSGPLDLLLELVKKQKLNIVDINISEITDLYMDYIQQNAVNLELTSEFILMAAYLTLLKSRALLPNKKKDLEDDFVVEDEKKNFEYMLLRYRIYKNLAELLGKKTKLFVDEYKAPKRDTSLFEEDDYRAGNVFILAKYAFVPKTFTDKINQKNANTLKKDILYIVSRYPDGFVAKDIFSLKEIRDVYDIVGVFLASLELVRLGFLYLEFKNHKILATTTKPLSLFEDYSVGV